MEIATELIAIIAHRSVDEGGRKVGGGVRVARKNGIFYSVLQLVENR